MNTARELVELLQSSEVLVDFLNRDLKTTNEIGFCLGESGDAYQLSEGGPSKVGIQTNVGRDGEGLIPVHTHPTAFSVDPSDKDIQNGLSYDRIRGGITLSGEMFETTWDGVAISYNGSGEEKRVSDTLSFRIVCDGTTDGPAEERYAENPRFEY